MQLATAPPITISEILPSQSSISILSTEHTSSISSSSTTMSSPQDQPSVDPRETISDHDQKKQTALHRYKAKMTTKDAADETRTKPVAVFTDFPAEIVYKIASYCGEKEINGIALCNSKLYEWVNQELYETNIKKGGSSALFWAAAKGKLSTLKLMVNFGVDLHLATSPNNPYLNVDEWSEINGTALHVAVKHGQFEIVDFLIKKGLDTEQETTGVAAALRPLNSLELAIGYANPSMGIFLIRKGFGANLGNGLLQAGFEMALKHEYGIRMPVEQHWLLLQFLQESGAEVNVPGDGDTTSLDLVFEYATKDSPAPERIPLLLDLLLENDIDIHGVLHGREHNDYYGVRATALHITSLLGLTDYVKYLLDHGAEIEAKDMWGRTPLAYAIGMSHEWESEPLHCDEYDLTDPYNGDITWRGSVGTVLLLLDHGANPDVKYCSCVSNAYACDCTMQEAAIQNTNRSFRVTFAGGLISKNVGVEKEDLNGDEHAATEAAEGTSLFGQGP